MRKLTHRSLPRWLLVSLAGHLALALGLLLLGALRPPAEPGVAHGPPLEVELVRPIPGAVRQQESARASDQVAADPAAPARPPVRPPAPDPTASPAQRGAAAKPDGSPRTVSPLLSMRRGELDPPPQRAQRQQRRRFVSFWGHRGQRVPGPRVMRRLEANRVQLTRYADGGRLLSSTVGGQHRPDLGTVALLDLASEMVGGRTGREACNPYPRELAGPRTLVLLVDTSDSVGRSGRRPQAVACAAGAALAALAQGHAVELLNFSSATLHQPPTRSAAAIVRTLSTFQGRGSRLPVAARLVSASATPRDFVLITDTAISNLPQTLPTYVRATRTNAENRAILFLLGPGVVCDRCRASLGELCLSCDAASHKTLLALRHAGFQPRPVSPPAGSVSGIAALRMLRRMLFF